MSRLSQVFKRGRKALIAYITVGYPNIETTLRAVPVLSSAGCDIVELGVPFSDPIADGSTIQRASFRALKQGVTPAVCLEVAVSLRPKIDTALVFMSYYNPLLQFGLDKFCQSCAEAEVDGLIVPDMPPEEGEDLERMSSRYGLDLIYFLAPTSTEERIEVIGKRAQGFIYLVSVAGVTGARDTLPPELEDFVMRVRRKTGKPICVGFGIASPEEAHRVAQVADGVIVGSKLIELLEGSSMEKACSFIRDLREALDRQG